MRSHSHCKRKSAAREGGWLAPSPGRNPGGARNKEMKPASSNMPSDWYSEKSLAVDTNERKQTRQIASIARGQMFKTRSNDVMSPIQHTANNMPEPLENQSREGAYQKRTCATPDRPRASRYSPAGRIPWGPMSPRIWNRSDSKAEK